MQADEKDRRVTVSGQGSKQRHVLASMLVNGNYGTRTSKYVLSKDVKRESVSLFGLQETEGALSIDLAWPHH
jgi:hypothetical protein